MIKLIKPDVGAAELAAVERVFESGFLAQGPTTKEFEKQFAAYVHAKHALATTSCTAALHVSVLALGLRQGDEVVVPSFTFPASQNAVALAGANVAFCDVDSQTFNIDAASLEKAITPRTRAVMPIHLFGQSADMDAVMRVAKKHGLRLIEDAANSLGTLYKGKHVGTIGDLGCFSFHPRKALTTGEGGAITTNDDSLAALCASLKDHGKNYVCKNGDWSSSTSSFVRPGFNYRMSDILAAVGLAQLPRFNATIARRQELAARYTKLFASVEGELLRTPKAPSFGNHVFQSYVVYLLKDGIRDKIIASLKQKGIETQIGTYAVHLQPAYAKEAQAAVKHGVSLSNSELVFRNTLTLPLYSSMTDAEQELVVKELVAELKKA